MRRWPSHPIPLLLACALLGSSVCQGATLRVATLHPLLADLARQIGGDRVEVIDLIGPTGDPHHFEPKPADLEKARDARLYLAAGKDLETYLPALKAIVEPTAKVIEVGNSLPSLEADGAVCEHDHGDHDEHAHAVDPHWWQSIDQFRRATNVVCDALIKADDSNIRFYQARAAAYRLQLDALETWARREIARIPKARRQLATNHAAFNYFCRDFGFTAIPLQGLNREQEPDPKKTAKQAEQLQKSGVIAIFPEREANAKILAALINQTNIRFGQALIADGMQTPSYEAMMRHNVQIIVDTLAP